MNNRPKVSILIAVYNGENALKGSIESLQKQTLKDIEIICVNDCSTDNSVDVINSYASEDSRIKLVSFDENRGTVCARKAGVQAANGEYIMFMDQDDTYIESACDELYNLIKEKDVDILHYRSKVVPIPPTTEEAAMWQERFLHPYDGYLYNKDIFDYCYKPNEELEQMWNVYTWNLWNKMYRTDLCKQAMNDCKEDYVINGDDVYVYMLIAYYAKSYFGDAQGKYYHVYNYGTGLMGHYKLNMNRFYTICRRMAGYRNEELFLEEKGIKEECKDVLAVDFVRSLNGIVKRWYKRLADEDRKRGIDMMLQEMSNTEMIKGLHKHLRVSYDKLALAVIGADAMRTTKRQAKTIGMYFSQNCRLPKACNLQLIERLESQGYRVVCFSEEETTFDFEGREYIVLPGVKEGKSYEYPIEERINVLNQALIDNNIDVYIYSGKKNPCMVYDFIDVKSNGIPFIFDASELSKYNKRTNTNSKDYYKYLRFMTCVDAVWVANENSTGITETLGVNYYIRGQEEESIEEVVIEGYTRGGELENAYKVIMKKYLHIISKGINNGRTQNIFKFSRIYNDFTKLGEKEKKAILNEKLKNPEFNPVYKSPDDGIGEVMEIIEVLKEFLQK
ncbi:MAG: glycosyltransferase family 2 protein [Lachnospiraceae bacterium]|nr:glycosyltransferase family 2 protein [Lachnospiraceae bacterium]